MSSAAYVDEAASWADALTQAESRRPGDYDNAMRRVGKATGVGYSALWGLRYRKPKRVFVDIYFALRTAHDSLYARQLEAIAREVQERKASGHSSPALDKAAALLRSMEE